MCVRRRFVQAAVVAAAAVAIIGLVPRPGWSQTTPTPTGPAAPSTTTTTMPPPSSTTTTTAPTTPSTPTTMPVTAPPPSAALQVSDAPGEPVPAVAAVVAPRAVPAVVAPETVEVLDVRLVAARESAEALAAATREATARVRRLELDLGAADEAVTRQRDHAGRAERDLAHAEDLLRQQAVGAYMWGGYTEVAVGFDSVDPVELVQGMPVVRAVLAAGSEVVDGERASRARSDDALARAIERRDAVAAELDRARAAEAEAVAAAEAARSDVDAIMAGRQVVIHGSVFPVAGPHSFGDSWAAPRMTGTRYAHAHQGTDILAGHGTPLVAVERGMILRMGTGTLGGIKLWLKGESGTYYYYAHLSAYAAGTVDGRVVDAGTVVGYVGDTGNARGGPPHVHFEIHPGGGPPVNPYPLLVAIDRARPG
jgi:murein DD-endopeptidase MepM/ murein hydrolase activator NlpD